MSTEKKSKSLRPETQAAQALGRVDEATRAIVPPLHPSTTYLRDPDGGYSSGRGYTRPQNPSYDTPEDLLATLEGGASCILFSSGMAAATAVFQSLLPGDHVIVPRVMYWALRKWLHEFAMSWGLEVEMVDTSDNKNIAQAIRPGKTRLVWLETPANPTWEMSDIAGSARIAHEANARLVVDNTVPTPVLTRPIEFGADLVVHSATKYLNGHSDVLAGAIVTAKRNAFWQRIRTWQGDAGAVLGPFEAWLLLRGMRTLFPRVNQSSQTALTVARHFQNHARVAQVLYPGLEDHPQHELARRQMTNGFGGMLSIRLADGHAAAVATAARVNVFKRATSLGGVESLIEHRASIEGAATPVPFDLLRLSIGLEHPDDLIADLDQALSYTDNALHEVVLPETIKSSETSNDAFSKHVAQICNEHIRPTIQDRGGDIEVLVQNQTVHLTVSGSPGALVPLRDWISGVLKHYIPEIEDVNFEIGDFARDSQADKASDESLEQFINDKINPALSAHGGVIHLTEFRDSVVNLRFDGRCQGCAMAEVTLRQGVETLIREQFSEIRTVVDLTDHEAGTNPYFSPGKGGGAK